MGDSRYVQGEESMGRGHKFDVKLREKPRFPYYDCYCCNCNEDSIGRK